MNKFFHFSLFALLFSSTMLFAQANVYPNFPDRSSTESNNGISDLERLNTCLKQNKNTPSTGPSCIDQYKESLRKKITNIQKEAIKEAAEAKALAEAREEAARKATEAKALAEAREEAARAKVVAAPTQINAEDTSIAYKTDKAIEKAVNELSACTQRTPNNPACLERFEIISSFLLDKITQEDQQVVGVSPPVAETPQSEEPYRNQRPYQNNSLWKKSDQTTFSGSMYLGISLDTWSETDYFEDDAYYLLDSGGGGSAYTSAGTSYTLGGNINKDSRLEFSLISSPRVSGESSYHTFDYGRTGVGVKYIYDLIGEAQPAYSGIQPYFSIGLQLLRSRVYSDEKNGSDWETVLGFGLTNHSKRNSFFAEINQYTSAVSDESEIIFRLGYNFKLNYQSVY